MHLSVRSASYESPYLEDKFKGKVVTNIFAIIASAFALLYDCKIILKYKYIRDGGGKPVILHLSKYSVFSVKEHD